MPDKLPPSSLRALDAVLKRLLCDDAFRRRMRQDASAALAGYALTAKQRAALSRLQTQPSPEQPAQPVRLTIPPQGHGFSLN